MWCSYSFQGEAEGFKDMTVILEIFLKWNVFQSSLSVNGLNARVGVLCEDIPPENFWRVWFWLSFANIVCKLEGIWGKRKDGQGGKINKKKNNRPSTWGHFLNNTELRKDSGILLYDSSLMKTFNSLCSLSALPSDLTFSLVASQAEIPSSFRQQFLLMQWGD